MEMDGCILVHLRRHHWPLDPKVNDTTSSISQDIAARYSQGIHIQVDSGGDTWLVPNFRRCRNL
jgi:hypothetical protein